MRGPLHHKTHRPWALPGIACAAFAVLAVAVASPVQAARTPEPLSDDGIRAGIEPANGRLRDMSVEDARSLSADMQRMFDRSPEMLQPLQLLGGMLMVELPETYMEVTIVQALSNGTHATFCAPEREVPAFAVDPAVPAILLPIWANVPAATPIQAAGSSGLEEK